MRFHRFSLPAAFWLALNLQAWATTSVTIPGKLTVPTGDRPNFILRGIGMQVYEWATNADVPSKTEWVLKTIDAQMSSDFGKIVAKHYDGPTWEATDGSKTSGTVMETASAPDPNGAIPWQLLKATSSGIGLFGKVKYIQRVATSGGRAPAACKVAEVGKIARIGYMAEYYFYTAK